MAVASVYAQCPVRCEHHLIAVARQITVEMEDLKQLWRLNGGSICRLRYQGKLEAEVKVSADSGQNGPHSRIRGGKSDNCA